MSEDQIEKFAQEYQVKLDKYLPNFVDTEELVNLALECIPEPEEK